MIKPAMLAYAAHFAYRFVPRLLQVKRRTWIGLGLGMLVFFGLLLWAFIALVGWLFGLVQSLSGDVGQAVRAPYQAVVEKSETLAPAVVAPLRAALEPWLPESVPTRDVSGQDLGPVPRFPGMVRSQWFQEGAQARVEYQGMADFAGVLDHYVQAFARQGYAQQVQAATPDHETHRFIRGTDAYVVEIRNGAGGWVSVRIEARAS